MPDILKLKTVDWELTVWTKEISSSLGRLALTMATRAKSLPQTSILFSPPLNFSAKASVQIDKDPVSILPSDSACSEIRLESPLFFENKLYEFEFIFEENVSHASANEPRLIHDLAAVNDSFRFHRHRGTSSLRGCLNFGNDIGWFRLPLRFSSGGKFCNMSISIEVLPVKLDLAADMNSIYRRVDQEFPLWRFALAEKTSMLLQRSKQPHEHFPLLWLAQFDSLRNKLEAGLKLIVNSPHSNLLSTKRPLPADRIHGRIGNRMVEKISEGLKGKRFNYRYQVEKKILSVDTPENRFIKMVLKRSTQSLVQFSLSVKQSNAAPQKQRFSESFFEKLNSWRKPLEQYSRLPLFSEIGEFEGLSRESLVLQQKAGYAKVYRIWQQFKLYLDMLGSDATSSMKSVDELYEVWCFIEIRKILLELDFTEQFPAKNKMNDRGLERSLIDGKMGEFNFSRADGITVRLAHEETFEKAGKKKIRSWITKQRPDILLEATFSSGESFIWLFDAKYRIKDEDADNGMGNSEYVPDDAINQMHRYRDALIHIHDDVEGSTKSRPVFGAFALYPGFYYQTLLNDLENPYAEAIEQIGIGAFPLLPEKELLEGVSSGNAWLKKFLAKKLGTLNHNSNQVANSDHHFVQPSAKISAYGMQQIRYEDLTLVVTAAPKKDRDTSYIEKFNNGTARWYHMKLLASERKNIERNVMKEIRFCAIATTNSKDQIRAVHFIWPVRTVRLVKRKSLTLEQAGSISDTDSDYWLFELGDSIKLPKPISGFAARSHQMKLTLATELANCHNFSSLKIVYDNLDFNTSPHS